MLAVLIFGTVAFVFLAPIIPTTQNCVNPGCGGPQYDSLAYYMFGVGNTVSFRSPDTPYQSEAIVITIMFLLFAGLGIATVVNRQRAEASARL